MQINQLGARPVEQVGLLYRLSYQRPARLRAADGLHSVAGHTAHRQESHSR